MESIDWVDLAMADRYSMAKMMRENLAADIEAGRGMAFVVREMVRIEDYEEETKRLFAEFKDCANGKRAAYYYLKKNGAIS